MAIEATPVSTTPVTFSLRLLGTAALTALALVACDADDVERSDEELLAADAQAAEDPAREIIDNLRLAGYPEIEIEVRDDGVVMVGRDAEVSLGASREMIGLSSRDPQQDGDTFRQYRTSNQIAPSIGTICVNGAAFTGTLSTALDGAISSYNSLPLRFEMVRTSGSAVGCDAQIKMYLAPGSGGLAGFPAFGIPYDSVYIGSGVAGFGTAVATHVITHELGHCIGFRHSDYYNRSISCGSGGNEGAAGVGAIHIAGTPNTAVDNGSVMNSCFNLGSTGEWTNSDVTALGALY
jgi:hypothetical protein